MKFSLSWLKQHLKTTASTDDIAVALTNIGLEVEEIIDPSQSLKGFVVGYVESCQKHPDADRLSLCMINDGSGSLQQVICGAPNVRQGLHIAFARMGSIVPSTGQVLKRGKLRGIESCGMVCSAKELLLGEESDGIMELDNASEPGTALVETFKLDNPIFDISITPNRADCFNVRGIARDLAAYGVGEFIDNSTVLNTDGLPSALKINIHDKEACPYFSAIKIDHVKNCPSPLWLKKRIEEAGQQSISALVDISNFIMFDLGQPLHVFDAKMIEGNINVRLSDDGEEYVALNEETYSLKNDIVIADDKKILGLAAIKGGLHSGTQMDTTSVIVEAALFNKINIANSGQRLNLFSDARARFERGLDTQFVHNALSRAVELIQEVCGGDVVGFSAEGSMPQRAQPFDVSLSFLSQKAGQAFTQKQVITYLEKLGCSVSVKDDDIFVVSTPSWRHDIEKPEDILEEVLRLHGYDNIKEESLPLMPVQDNFTLTHKAKRRLVNAGLDEVYTFSMIDAKTADYFKADKVVVPILAPLNSELAILRPSLIPSLIKVAQHNKTKSIANVSVFEVAPVFYMHNDTPSQNISLAGIRFNKTHDTHWAATPRIYDIFDTKADVLEALEAFNIKESSLQISINTPDYYHPKRSGCLMQGKKVIAYFGELHPKVLKNLNIKNPCLGFEILIHNLPNVKAKVTKGVMFSQYQPVNRDFAFIMDKATPVSTLMNTIKKVDQNLIQDVLVFDVYEGDKLPADKKSIAIRIKVQSDDRTLTDDEMMNIQNKIISEASKMNALIRDGQ
ncbi:MAG: phenylalanine--tRNA ligase subunit beta [Alphaproteobacteria bacterium CG_4_10_14_0_8_um_filter_37_21]|nr:MAG: phenylalanine--tRNA ligase subunit beta [Alphaproteobacteria bacterium CG_4_10_14_0_8_um_filter_37_21]